MLSHKFKIKRVRLDRKHVLWGIASAYFYSIIYKLIINHRCKIISMFKKLQRFPLFAVLFLIGSPIAFAAGQSCGTQSAINSYLLAEEVRSSCIAMCERTRINFIALDFDSIADPDERRAAIVVYYDGLSPCAEECTEPSPPDSASACVTDCDLTALEAFENCPSGDGVSDIVRGQCLEVAGDDYLVCTAACEP